MYEFIYDVNNLIYCIDQNCQKANKNKTKIFVHVSCDRPFVHVTKKNIKIVRRKTKTRINNKSFYDIYVR